MREDLKRTYKGATILNIIISTGVAFLLLLLMVDRLDYLRDFLAYCARWFNISSTSVISRYLALFVAGICIIVDSVVFAFLQSHQARYIKTIEKAMNDISKGELDVTVPIEGDDELAHLAASLNTMADDIKTLIERERATEKSKNELITNVAHDLRTPLTSILGYLELLNTHPDIAPEVRQKYIDIATNKARHLQRLIEELFGFTKLNYGKLSLHVSEVDIVKLLEQLVNEFYPVFEQNEMECEFTSSVPSLKMNGDGNLLARLFDNLINNAVKYGKEGKVLLIKLDYSAPVITISVTNFGNVIPENEIPFLFNKFYRVEQSRSSNTGGTGLGLAIAKNITELHAGSIECRSSIRGTVFEVKLPSDFDINKEQFKSIDGDSIDE